jgi:hypothetical protein
LALSVGQEPVGAQTAGGGQQGSQSTSIPRARDGKPDFSGIWQVFNTANISLLSRSAGPDGPASVGVVDGYEIPYRPEALARKQDNFANRAARDPEARSHQQRHHPRPPC